MFSEVLLAHMVILTDETHQDPVWKHRKSRHDHSNPDFDYDAWKRKHTAFADEAVPVWVKAVKDRYAKAGTKFACVGYCFGAPYVCNELARNTVAVGAFAHPAFLKEHHFKNLKSGLQLLQSMWLRADTLYHRTSISIMFRD